MKGRTCHYCGQTLPEHRLGARMTPQQGGIFDLVCRGGEYGIQTQDLIAIANVSPDSLKVQICKINERISDSGYRIRGYRGFYRLEKAVKGKDYRPRDALTPAQQKALGL